MAMAMTIVMMVMRMMTRTTMIARLATMMVATVMMNLFDATTENASIECGLT